MKKILVPTDFSSYANKALAYAAELAHKGHAELVIIHACDLLHHRFSRHKELINEHNRAVTNELFERLDIVKQSVEQMGVATVTKLYYGPVLESVLEAAHAYRASLIVMGTLGKSGLRRKLLGSKVAAVINQSEVPVLTVPHTYKLTELKKILIAVDELREGPQVLQPVFELAQWCNATVEAAVFTEEEADAFEVMTHTRDTRFIEQQLKRALKGSTIEVHHVVGSNLLDTLRLLVAQKDIDLLTMITRKRAPLENFFTTSFTQKMSYESHVPLLSLHVMSDE